MPPLRNTDFQIVRPKTVECNSGRPDIPGPVARRDDYSRCMFMLMTGGAVRGRQVIGKSDDKATLLLSTGIFLDDAVAAFYHKLGIDHSKNDRPISIIHGSSVTQDLFS